MLEDNSLPLASTQKRMTSFVIDDIIIAVLLLVIFYEQLMQLSAQFPISVTIESYMEFNDKIKHFFASNLLTIVLLKILYHTFFIWQNGMTLGKYFMKIEVIELETRQNPSFIKALLRAGLRLMSEVFFYLGFLLAFFLPLKQTLHDKLSGCVVVDA